jgi:RNA polymerase sigma-70 factor (ECF subfamily)
MRTPIGPAQLAGWFREYGGAMVLFGRQWLEAAAAEDVVQDVFARLMAQRRPPVNVKTWLFRAVRNAALNRVRDDRRRQHRETTQAIDRIAWFQSATASADAAETVRRAVESLPPEDREIVILRVWAAMTFEEIAATVGQPTSTVHSRYGSALGALQRRLEQP